MTMTMTIMMMIYMVPCFSGFLNFHPVLSLASLEEPDKINSTLLLPMKNKENNFETRLFRI